MALPVLRIASEVDSEEEVMSENVAAMLWQFERHRGNLIPILQAIQEKHLYLSRSAMEMVAMHLDISPGEVYGVATFYNQFRFQPPGRHQIKVCLGTACHVAGGEIILENFERKLGIRDGQTTPDREYSVERVACVGCCALAPVAVVDEQVQAHMQPSKVEGMFIRFQVERERQEREEAGRGPSEGTGN
jgi:NADH-quinone oxidoreductase subunit E